MKTKGRRKSANVINMKPKSPADWNAQQVAEKLDMVKKSYNNKKKKK